MPPVLTAQDEAVLARQRRRAWPALLALRVAHSWMGEADYRLATRGGRLLASRRLSTAHTRGAVYVTDVVRYVDGRRLAVLYVVHERAGDRIISFLPGAWIDEVGGLVQTAIAAYEHRHRSLIDRRQESRRRAFHALGMHLRAGRVIHMPDPDESLAWGPAS